MDETKQKTNILYVFECRAVQLCWFYVFFISVSCYFWVINFSLLSVSILVIFIDWIWVLIPGCVQSCICVIINSKCYKFVLWYYE